MTTKYSFTRDINSYPTGLALPFADDGYQVEIKESAGAEVVVPSNFSKWVAKVVCSPMVDVWASDEEITLPADNNPTASRAQVVSPLGSYFLVSAGSSIFVETQSTDEVSVSISFYALNNA